MNNKKQEMSRSLKNMASLYELASIIIPVGIIGFIIWGKLVNGSLSGSDYLSDLSDSYNSYLLYSKALGYGFYALIVVASFLRFRSRAVELRTKAYELVNWDGMDDNFSNNNVVVEEKVKPQQTDAAPFTVPTSAGPVVNQSSAEPTQPVAPAPIGDIGVVNINEVNNESNSI